MKEIDAKEMTGWIVRAAVAGEGETEILAGICDRLNAAGLSLVRASLACNFLDPTSDARGVRWLRQSGGVEEAFPRDNQDWAAENWDRSPFRFLVESGERMLRRRLDATHAQDEFPLLDRFQSEGATDYVALLWRVGEGVLLGGGQGLVASWSTDAPAGFTEAQIELLSRILPALTLVIMFRTNLRAARALITTYLGSDAAERVLAGNIVRGRAEPIRAVVWHSDLVGFTRISDNATAATVLALLNDYAEAVVEEVEAHGGHVLKFIGDGILAIFPQDDTALACRRALDAAVGLRERISALNQRRTGAGLPVTDAHIALHLGELLYGNLGSARRLDFTVLGPAVNEAARIEALCGSLEQPIIVSSAFAEAAGDARSRLVSLGRYAMKGVGRAQELFTVELATNGLAAELTNNRQRN
jgi:adenylate cyclase